MRSAIIIEIDGGVAHVTGTTVSTEIHIIDHDASKVGEQAYREPYWAPYMKRPAFYELLAKKLAGIGILRDAKSLTPEARAGKV